MELRLAIAQRRLGTQADVVIQHIEALDTQALPGDKAELLLHDFVPSKEEAELLNKQHDSGKPMAEIDMFVYQLSRVPRLREKLNLLASLDGCAEALETVQPNANIIIASSESLLGSKKIRKLLEIILAFGNYMNSQRRGPAFGFKLSAFDRILDIRSRDRTQNLMNCVAHVITSTFPEIRTFYDDLVAIDKGATVSLASMEYDVLALERTASAVLAELKNDPTHPTLLSFRDQTMPKINAAREAYNRARSSYTRAAKYFAEDSNTEPSVLFGTFVRVHTCFERALEENVDHARRLEQQHMWQDDKDSNPAEESDYMEIVPNENTKLRTVAARSEVGDGDIDQIISDMRTVGYRRPGLEHKLSKEKREIGHHDQFESYAKARPWLK